MSLLQTINSNRAIFDPDRTVMHLLTPRFQASGHVIAFLYKEGECAPHAVVKFPRIPGDDSRLKREARNLKALENFLTPNEKSVPHVIEETEWQNYHILVQSAVAGKVLERALVKENPDFYIEHMMSWLINLARVSKTRNAERWHDPVYKPMHKIEHWLGELNAEWALTDKAKDIFTDLKAFSFPFVFEHGDTSAPNILVDNQGQIGVVDWELGNPKGYPGMDLFFFLMFVAFARAGAERLDQQLLTFENAFLFKDAWTRPYIERYFAELELPLQAVRPLFALCWLRYVTSLIDRLVKPGLTPFDFEKVNQDWFRQNRYVQMLRASLHAHEFVV